MNQSNPQQPWYLRIASKDKISYILMIVACISWVSGYIYSNNNNLNPFQTGMLRGFVLTLGSYFICKYNGDKMEYRNQKGYKNLMIRNILFTFHGLLVAWLQFYIPLPIMHTIGSCGPICVLFIQFFLEGKKPNYKESIGILLAFAGVLLNANGRLISKLFDPDYEFNSTFENYKSTDTFIIALFSILQIVGMFAWAYAVLITKNTAASVFQINYHFAVILIFFSTIAQCFQENKTEGEVMYYGIFWTGILLLIAQTAFVGAILWSVNVGVNMMLGTFTAAVAYFYSIVLYGEKLNFFCVAGSICIIVGIYKIIF